MSARVIDATPEGSRCSRFFVKSASTPGAWWRVDLLPGESLTCSCPAGRRAGTDLNAKPCRHLAAIVDRVFAERVEEVA